MAAAAKRGMRGRRALGVLMLLAPLALGLAWALDVQRHPLPEPAVAFPRGEIVFGVDASLPPFALDEDGELRGLDIDLGRAIAAEIGLPARFVNIGYYGLHDALIRGKVDLLISALRFEPARMGDLLYSTPYFDDGLVLAAGAGRADAEAIDGISVAYEYASAAESQLRAWEDTGERLERRPYELPEYALDALRLDLADAALVHASTYRLYLRERADFTSDMVYVTSVPYALAARRDQPDAMRLVDEALLALSEAGMLGTIVSEWL